MALSAMAKSVILQACESKLELKTGELGQHVGAAYDFMLKRMHGDKQAQSVRAELKSIGFEW